MGINDFLAADRPSRVSSFWDNVPLPAKADIAGRRLHVRWVPKGDIRTAANLFDHLVGER
jgi:hypothetical protein